MTEGEVDLDGRVGSLLEVGTGFHHELTGRENIFLNGAILGMTRAEIRQQFDEIVDFAGVERFLDTPVKRYSSGMYVRLAFAVAAHLSSEILIVDEVLAVGDQEFQQKCLGKMREVATDGRTVLLVSHNMAAVTSLCSRAVVLRAGRLVFVGDVDGAVAEYSSREGSRSSATCGTGAIDAAAARFAASACRSRPSGELTRSVRPRTVRDRRRVRGEDGAARRRVQHRRRAARRHPAVDALQRVSQRDVLRSPKGAARFPVRSSGLPLRPDTYSLNVFIGATHAVHDFVDRAMSFDVESIDVFGTGRLPDAAHGPLIANFRWTA